ncbi:hypothetical protein [Amycolatopsis sp. NPDC004079]|uniref:hypothetical protein n=1 Tax=Amycolatopsis sp. NPDC004079 TaxID=3154549 RepID=UPI0033B4E841
MGRFGLVGDGLVFEMRVQLGQKFATGDWGGDLVAVGVAESARSGVSGTLTMA